MQFFTFSRAFFVIAFCTHGLTSAQPGVAAPIDQAVAFKHICYLATVAIKANFPPDAYPVPLTPLTDAQNRALGIVIKTLQKTQKAITQEHDFDFSTSDALADYTSIVLQNVISFTNQHTDNIYVQSCNKAIRDYNKKRSRVGPSGDNAAQQAFNTLNRYFIAAARNNSNYLVHTSNRSCDICHSSNDTSEENPYIQPPCGHKFHSRCFARNYPAILRQATTLQCPACYKNTFSTLSCRRQEKKFNSPVHNPAIGAIDVSLQLHHAAITGNVEQARSALEQENCIDAKNTKGQTALHLAVVRGNFELVKLLLDNNINTNIMDERGKSALYLAIENKLSAMVHFLVTHPTNPAGAKLCIDDSCTALHIAAESGYLQLVRYFTEVHRANINALDSDGNTPLLCAIESNHTENAQYLLEHGADITAGENSPLERAMNSGNLPIVQCLIETHHASLAEGESLLHLAAKYGDLHIVKYFVECLKLDKETFDDDGNMPMHVAFLENRFDIVEYFIKEQRLDPDAETDTGLKLMDIAVGKNDTYLVGELIKLGCSTDLLDDNGLSLLYDAARDGHSAMVQYLVETVGFDVNIASNDGWTPVHTAVEFGHIDVVRYLLARGAKVHATATEDEITALELARHRGHAEIEALLREHGAIEPASSVETSEDESSE